MRSNWWLDSGVAAILLAHLALLAGLIRRGRIKNWPSLFAYAAFTILSQVALLLLRPHYTYFFWTYWYTSAVLIALRVWIVFDALRAIPAIEHFPRFLAKALAVAIFFLVVAAVYIAWRDSPNFGATIISFVISASKAANLACACTLITLFAGFLISGFGWPAASFDVCIAMLSRATAGLIAIELLSLQRPHTKLLGNGIDTLAELGCICAWAVSAWRPQRAGLCPPEYTPAIDHFLNRLRHTLQQSREPRP